MSEHQYERSAEEPTVRVEVQPHEKPSIAIVRALESVTGTAATEIDPLYEYVDPEAIDKLFADTSTVDRRGTVTFTIDDLEVTIVDGSTVEVRR